MGGAHNESTRERMLPQEMYDISVKHVAYPVTLTSETHWKIVAKAPLKNLSDDRPAIKCHDRVALRSIEVSGGERGTK